MIDGVETHDGAIHADERDGRARADEGVAFHENILGFGMRAAPAQGRAEELQPGAAAKVHGTSTGVLKTVAADGDLARAALGLDTSAADGIRVAENVALDDTSVTANHVDARTAASSPALNPAIFDPEIDTPESLMQSRLPPGPTSLTFNRRKTTW